MLRKVLLSLILSGMSLGGYAQYEVLSNTLIFYAPFDGDTQAQFAVGDTDIYTALDRKALQAVKKGLEGSNTVLAKDVGLHGDALEFKKKGKPVVFYDAFKNMGYSKESWSGAISFWLRLDPAQDLEPGFCDPIQITDVNYNDASIWVDFTKANPRDFRLGVLGDLSAWNPQKLGPDNNPEFEKRLVRVKTPPFSRASWTHIVINFSKLGTSSATSHLFINGALQGSVQKIADPFTWEEEKAKIFLGLNYIGLMDELSVFERPLSTEAIDKLFRVKSLKTLISGKHQE